MKSSFTIPGNPRPKARPRFSSRSGRAYSTKETARYEQKVGACALRAGIRISGGAFEVVLAFWMGDKRKRDLDNCIKAVLDGLNGVAWYDDHQVKKITAAQEVDRENPRCEVILVAQRPRNA